MSTPENKAAWLTALKAYPLQVGPALMPTPEATDVVIQVHSAALNPADPAMQQRGVVVKPEGYPYILGIDIAGIITAVGPKNTRFKLGDRVTALAAPSLLGDAKYGGFQLYAVGDDRMIAKIPDRLSFNEASVLPLGLCTAAYSLFEKAALALDLPKPGGNAPNGQILLVWGGASSVGACAIQAAKAAGYNIAATASAKNFGLLREIGAEYVFDYNNACVVDEIVTTLKGKGELAGIFSAIGQPAPLAQCAAVAGQLEGRKHVGTVRPPGFPALENWPEGVEISSCGSTHIIFSEVGPAIWRKWLPVALEDGSMKCRPHYEVVGKGLEGVQGAVDLISKGVSGKKLVVEIAH
ncbi:zinc-binding oxidoreductase CipB [Mycena maculata]|uniref:Zinc-binding oxidoreductase CipB n=1 Tax=Mycena maculata TaxID=230809 RepID=A0AAD7MZ09_9AGAR|nr:zinc-binding oxidoreductase CipB [Mycena maculata]